MHVHTHIYTYIREKPLSQSPDVKQLPIRLHQQKHVGNMQKFSIPAASGWKGTFLPVFRHFESTKPLNGHSLP